MSGKTIFETHKMFLLLNTLFGYIAPKIPTYSYPVLVLLKFVNLLIISILLFSTVVIIGGLSDPRSTMEQACSTAILCFTLVIATFNSFYIFFRSNTFDSIISLMNKLTVTFTNDPFGNRLFRDKLNAQYKIIIAYSIVTLVCTTVAASNYVVPMYLQSFKSLGFSGEVDLPFKLWSPIDYYISPAYEFAFFIELYAICVGSIKKLISELLIITLLHVISLFLQHLKYSLDVVFSEIDDVICDTGNTLHVHDRIMVNEGNHDGTGDKIRTSHKLQSMKVKVFPAEDGVLGEEIRIPMKSTGSVSNSDYLTLEDEDRNKKIAIVHEKLKQWVILHQDVLKLCSEFGKFLDPILTVYLCCITAAITLAAFTFTMGFAQTFAQITAAVFYYMACMMSLYLLCLMGHSVTYESLTVADSALYTRWYNTNKKIPNELKIIFQRVKTPVLMTAFRSPNLDLSKGTFLVFAKSTLSFYLALIELQKRRDIKSN